MRKLLTAIAALFPAVTHAQDTLPVSTLFDWNYGVGNLTITNVISNITTTLEDAILWIAAAVFFTGAFVYTISAEGENRKTYGKKAMIGALVSLAIIYGAKAIMNTVLYFVFGP